MSLKADTRSGFVGHDALQSCTWLQVYHLAGVVTQKITSDIFTATRTLNINPSGRFTVAAFGVIYVYNYQILLPVSLSPMSIFHI